MPVHAGQGALTGVRAAVPAADYPRCVLDELRRVAESDPHREVCGFVVRRPGRDLAVVRVANCAAPALARTRFVMQPAEQARVLCQLEREGGVVVAVFHSHVGGDARLSSTDRAEAMAGPDPWWPGVEQLVVAVRHGRAGEIRRYRFSAGDFEEFPFD